jgi:hypothetical protein
MGRSEFIALLKRVGPLASYWWDGAHVVAASRRPATEGRCADL